MATSDPEDSDLYPREIPPGHARERRDAAMTVWRFPAARLVTVIAGAAAEQQHSVRMHQRKMSSAADLSRGSKELAMTVPTAEIRWNMCNLGGHGGKYVPTRRTFSGGPGQPCAVGQTLASPARRTGLDAIRHGVGVDLDAQRADPRGR